MAAALRLTRETAVFARRCQVTLFRGNQSHKSAKDRLDNDKAKTPTGRLDNSDKEQKNETLERFPNDKNPLTGEICGPRGPEPTRYGDWERKGRVTDF